MQDGSVSPIKAFFRNKWVRIVLAIDIVAIVVIIGIIIYNLFKNSIISFKITPIDATIAVNGDSSYSNGSFRFQPGIYEITISHANLDSKTFTIELQENSNAAITTFLSEDGNFDFYELKDNYPSFLMLSEIASSNDNQTTDNDTSAEDFIYHFQRNYNFYSNWLPVTYSDYDDNNELIKYVSIRQGQNCEFTLCLEAVMPDESDKAIVNSLLQGRGFNPEDFEIEYRIY